MFNNLLGSWYLKKKISNGFLGKGLVSLKSKKLNNFFYEEKSLIHKKGRQMNNSDLIQVNIIENNNFIKYSIWIGKQYPKFINCNKKQNYYIENPLDYNWIYTNFEYLRI